LAVWKLNRLSIFSRYLYEIKHLSHVFE